MWPFTRKRRIWVRMVGRQPELAELVFDVGEDGRHTVIPKGARVSDAEGREWETTRRSPSVFDLLCRWLVWVALTGFAVAVLAQAIRAW